METFTTALGIVRDILLIIVLMGVIYTGFALYSAASELEEKLKQPPAVTQFDENWTEPIPGE